jgi:hypothetical protein
MDTVFLMTSGDLRQSANQVCWPAQVAMEEAIGRAVARMGANIVRAHAYDDEAQSPIQKLFIARNALPTAA